MKENFIIPELKNAGLIRKISQRNIDINSTRRYELSKNLKIYEQ